MSRSPQHPTASSRLCKIAMVLSALMLSNAPVYAQNAFTRAGHGITYEAKASQSVSSGNTPLWLTANRRGLSSLEETNGYLRAGIYRAAEADSAYRWRLGYGADLAVAYHFDRTLTVKQLYADLDYRLVRLTVGAKDQPMSFKNEALSSGSQTFGINSLAVPGIMLSLPDYWNISGRGDWAAIRGFISYGMQTDGRFQRSYVAPGSGYSRYVLHHRKAGYLRLGNERKFPLVFEGGLEMATQFGGTVYRTDKQGKPYTIKPGHSLRDFVDATFGTGGDPTDDIYANATGNTVGSWLMRLSWKGKGWSAALYYDHYFEDHSQMFWQYGWRDGLIGAEVNLPENPVVSTLVFERLETRYQSGPLYHDHTANIPDQISAKDDYYNHGLYTGWEHWGQAMGNPLYVSPLYWHDKSLFFRSNRFLAHHAGISGQPLPWLGYRALYTHERSVGSYLRGSFIPARTTDSFLLEATLSPTRVGKLNMSGWSAQLGFALDRGDLIGDNTGFNITITRRGILTK